MNRTATFKFRRKTYTVTQTDSIKRIDGPDYHLKMDLRSGYTERWGATKDEDPVVAPFPEIMDCEIATKCKGVPDIEGNFSSCHFCYKANTKIGEETTVETVDRILQAVSFETKDGLVSPLTQIAWGIGNADNPNLLPIFKLTREKYGIVPNTTCNGALLTEEMIKEWGQVLGAVAISNYGEICLDAVEAFTRLTSIRCNIHQLVSESTYDQCMDILEKRATDPRLSKMYAIVFLMLKQKGRGRTMQPLLSMDKYKKLIDKAMQLGVPFGADSCSAPSMMKALESYPNAKEIYKGIDCCESGLMSVYANYRGEVFPCSFTEGSLGWWTPPKLTEVTNFIEEVWDTPQINLWRNNLLNSTNYQECESCSVRNQCRTCPSYKLDLCRS